MPTTCCDVDAVIRRAVRDAEAAYAARQVRVELDLACATSLATEEPVLEQSLYTIFRGLAARVAPGATLRVVTRDRAGGDVELSWEADEGPGSPPVDEPGQSARAYGDLLELALAGLERFCRARAGRIDAEDPPLRLAAGVRRRYVFLIPSLRRAPPWHPLKDRSRS